MGAPFARPTWDRLCSSGSVMLINCSAANWMLPSIWVVYRQSNLPSTQAYYLWVKALPKRVFGVARWNINHKTTCRLTLVYILCKLAEHTTYLPACTLRQQFDYAIWSTGKRVEKKNGMSISVRECAMRWTMILFSGMLIIYMNSASRLAWHLGATRVMHHGRNSASICGQCLRKKSKL